MRNFASIGEVFELLVSKGETAYFGEPVTVLEHSLQAAWLAQQQDPEEALTVAALLHDLGHLMENADEDAADRHVDTQHEELGAEVLKKHLPAAVIEPIRLHVTAKRFLCFSDGHLFSCLSPASVQSLALHGGPMSANEAEEFSALPYAQNAMPFAVWTMLPKSLGLRFRNWKAIVHS